MSAKKMHDGEVDIDVALVRELLAAQFPHWSHLPVTAVESIGTVNAIYRLGDDLCVRMPRVASWAGHLANELQSLPRLAPHLTLAVPEPVTTGEPANGYPFPWAVYRWLDGEAFTPRCIDERQAAADLAQFVTELRRVDTTDAHPSHRDAPARLRDLHTRAAIESLHGILDTAAVTAAWEQSLHAREFDGVRTWTHGDLVPPNVLVADGRINAVIDFGSAGAGDPAVDVIPAWSMFGTEGRHAYRDALDVENHAWLRARGLALSQALLIIPYYPDTNPEFVAMATRTVAEVLADAALR